MQEVNTTLKILNYVEQLCKAEPPKYQNNLFEGSLLVVQTCPAR